MRIALPPIVSSTKLISATIGRILWLSMAAFLVWALCDRADLPAYGALLLFMFCVGLWDDAKRIGAETSLHEVKKHLALAIARAKGAETRADGTAGDLQAALAIIAENEAAHEAALEDLDALRAAAEEVVLAAEVALTCDPTVTSTLTGAIEVITGAIAPLRVLLSAEAARSIDDCDTER